jgi:excisionase family DNA binding protein
MTKLLLTPDEAARVLRIGRTRMYALTASVEIACIRVGRSVRIPAEALREWIRARQSGESTDGLVSQ